MEHIYIRLIFGSKNDITAVYDINQFSDLTPEEFASKYLISFINEKWEPIRLIRLKTVPIKDEFIFFDDEQKYFRVLNVIHQIGKKQNIVVVITEFSPESIKK